MKLDSLDPEVLPILLRESGFCTNYDASLLEAALSYPLAIAVSGKADVAAIAASHAIGILRECPFASGNAQAAFLAMGLFLYMNGWRLVAAPEDATAVMRGLLTGEVDEAALGNWIRANL